MAEGGDKATKAGDPHDAECNIQNIYYIFTGYVDGLQIGDGNKMVKHLMSKGRELLKNPKEAEKQRISSDEIIVAMLNSILIPHFEVTPKEINLQTLETGFCNQYGESKMSFKKMTHHKLLTFLRSKPHLYNVRQESKTWMVSPILENRTDINVTTTDRQDMKLNNLQDLSAASEKKQNTPTPNSTEGNKQPSVKGYTKLKEHTTEEENKFLEDVDYFEKGHYILMTSNRDASKYASYLALIPWLLVFDLDQKSRKDGLLGLLENDIRKKRNLQICTIQEQPRLVDRSTLWSFCKGYSYRPQNSISDMNCMEWYKHVKDGLKSHVCEIAKFIESYTTLNIVVLWPDEGEIANNMRKMVEELVETIMPLPKVNICLLHKERTRTSEAVFETLRSGLDMICTNNLSLDDICMLISDSMADQYQSSEGKFQLPTTNTTSCLSISREEAVWLDVDLEVLYKDSPLSNVEDKEEILVKNFLRGGNLPWYLRYKYGANAFDVERDCLKPMVDSIKLNYIDKYNTGIITLFHSPGSGGTTLAQRILFELRDVTPCAEVRSQLNSNTSDVVSKVKFLCSKTNMPVLMMVDGDDENRVKHLLDSFDHTIHCIILYVKRYPYSMKGSNITDNDFYIQGKVSPTEAKALCLRFRAFCEQSRQNALVDLEKSVEKGYQHFLYEFGLTAYLDKFEGIYSFVQGLLRRDDNSELQPWQIMLGFLALIQYYGQIPVPIEFLSTVTSAEILSINDFPVEMKEILLRDFGDGRRNMIRVSHYVIAKEILNQLLATWHKQGNRDVELKISDEARENLYEFASQFISRAMNRKIKIPYCLSTTTFVFSRIFIFRDHRDIGELSDRHRQRKPMFSRLILDIPSSPPFTKRLNILKKLTEAFPDDPNFHAHLGRLYAYYRPEDEQKAEEHLKRALQLCNDQNQGTTVEGFGERMRHTLMLIHHMFGQIYIMRISKYTGLTFNDEPAIKTALEKVPSRITCLIDIAKSSIEHFRRCREVAPFGQATTYGFVGEINVRLQVCDFIYRHDTSHLSDIKSFLDDSMSAIDKMNIECCSIFDPDTIDQSFFHAMQRYSALFKKHIPTSIDMKRKDVKSRRLHIAATKLKYSHGESTATLDHIDNKEDIHKIVQSYEAIFHSVHNRHMNSSVRDLDFDYKEWLHAIRHSKFDEHYDLEDILLRVDTWKQTLSTQMSIFYLFVLQSVIGFGLNSENAKPEVLSEAQKTKDILQSRKILSKSRCPREWLGKGPEIKTRLIPGTRFTGQIEGREVKHGHLLPYMKGTIRPPNENKTSGTIIVDLGEIYKAVSVNVFFIPWHSKLDGINKADTRVEFILGFSIAHGYEAFNVRHLQTFECTTCGTMVEIKTDEEYVYCKCGNRVTQGQAYNDDY